MFDKEVLKQARNGAVTGLATGILGSFLGVYLRPYLGHNLSDISYIFTCGTTFGFGLGLLLRQQFGFAWWRVLFVTGLMPAIYYFSVIVAISSYSQIKILNEYVLPGIVGGALGAALTVLLISLFLRPQGWLKLVGAVAASGAVTGAILLPFVLEGDDFTHMVALHVPWHAVVLAVLMAALSQRMKAKADI